MAVAYKKDTDYQALINQAVANGDYSSAAKYEQQRNAKIKDLNASGTNKWNAQQTTNYAQYLGSGYTPKGTHNDTGLTGEAADTVKQAQNLWYKGSSLGDQAMMDFAHQMAEQARATAGYSGGADGSEYISLNNTPTPNGGQSLPTFNYNVSKPTYSSNNSARIDALLNQILNRDGFTFEDAPTYTDNYSGQIESMMGEIQNRDPFSYDAAADPMYQQYQTQYNREGNRSMNDTLAAAASGAGGMNSYAITAAQQANDYYAAQLADKIPELHQLAYEMYLQDFDQDVTKLNLLREQGETEYNRWRDSMSDWRADRSEAYGMYLDDIEQQVRDLGLMQDMDDTQYNRYRDTMSDWRNDRDFAYGMYRDDMSDYKWNEEFDYTKEQDAIDNAYRQEQADISNSQWQQNFDREGDQLTLDNEWRDKEWDYNVGRDALEDGRYDSETAYNKAMELLQSGAMPDAAMLKAAGMTEDQAKTILMYVQLGLDKELERGDYAPKNDEPIVTPATQQEVIDGTGLYEDMVTFPDKLPVKEGTEPEDESGDEPGGEDDKALWSAIGNLGVKALSASTVEELIKYGGVKLDGDKFVWINGWNQENWSKNLKSARSGSVGFYPIGFFD